MYHVHLHVGNHVSYHVGHRNVVATLCEVSETLTEWKSEISRTDDGLTREGARDTCVSKKSNTEKYCTAMSRVLKASKTLQSCKPRRARPTH